MNGQRLSQAIAGQPVRVFARIRNRGTLPAFPTRVSFAFVDASLGIAWSAPRLIGETGTDVPPNQLGPGVKDVECPEPWVPGASSTHACLLVMCDEVLMDHPAVPWSAGFDRHVAQRNVTILPAGPGKTLAFRLQFATVLSEGAAVRFAAQAAWVKAPDPEQALRYVPGREEPRGELQGTLLDTDVLRETVRPGRIEALGEVKQGPLELKSPTSRELPAFVPVGPRLESQPRELRGMDVDITVPMRVEAPYLLVRLAQVEDAHVTGGYTVLLQLREG
ncbi:hypothetical protein [Stigmatella erecta]|nr:hypothetical protein [Stigmatella erecta]